MRPRSITGPMRLTRVLALAASSLAVTACGGDDTGPPVATYGSASLAIDGDALFYAEGDDILRFDRITEEETTLAQFVPLAYGVTGPTAVLALNRARLFWVSGQDIESMSLDGGEPRVEASLEVGCVGECFAVTDDTLFHSDGRASDPTAVVVAVDLATAEATTITTPWAAAIAVDDTHIYGVSCYDLWAVPRDGGSAVELPLGLDMLGCPSDMMRSGDDLYFDGRSLFRIPIDRFDTAELQMLAPAEYRFPFVVRDGVAFAALDGAILRIDDDGSQELATATNVQGIAVAGDTLYWTEQEPDESVTLQHLEVP